MKFFPLEYEILPGLPSISSAPAVVQPLDVPGHVITLLPGGKERLNAAPRGCQVTQGDGFIFEDKSSDWAVRDGKFYFYSHALQPAARSTESPETADVMIVYKWLEISMSSDGIEDGRSTLRGVCHGYPMTIDIDQGKKPRGGTVPWTATFSIPSFGRIPLPVATALAQAQQTLIEFGERELARRMCDAPISTEQIQDHPAP